MHYFITGGTGLIGQAFIHSLTKDDSVTVLSRQGVKAQTLFTDLPCAVEVIDDLAEVSHFNDIDCVINMAGEPIADKRWSEAQKQRITDSRWQLTTQITKIIQASRTPPRTFISGSAIGFYGRQGDTPVTESDHQIHDEFSHHLCATWENIALGAQNANTRVCVTRTGVVLARGKGALGKMTLPFKLGLGGPISHGNQGMSWIHIEDMVAGLHYLIKNDALSGAFNFTAPEPVDNRTFSKTLGAVLSRPAILPMPALSLKLIMGEAADLLLTGQFVLPQRLQEAGFTFTYPSLKPALAAIF